MGMLAPGSCSDDATATLYAKGMIGLALSTVAYFVASVFIKRYLEDMGIPRDMTRGLVVFVLAVAVAYSVAFLVDLVSP
jgi:hypothetical protein